MNTFEINLILRLIIAVILGMVIGLERELKKKPLGLKTSTVISVISCLITIVSIESAYLFPESDFIEIRMDPLRLAAQIISGVGFLGAGVIMRRGNDHISGLTTAAIIWGAAGIGVAVGAGFHIEAVVGVLLLLTSVEFIPHIAMKVAPRRLYKRNVFIKIVVETQEGLRLIIEALEDSNYVITSKKIGDVSTDSIYTLEIKARVSQDLSLEDIYAQVKSMEHVKEVEVRN